MTLILKTSKPRAGKPPRAARIDSVCGRYAHVPTSSDRFAARKRREIDSEGRRQ